MFENFPNPPIKEALIDIRASLPEKIKINDIENAHLEFINDYPKKQEKHSWEGKFEIKKGNLTETSAKHLGFLGFLFKNNEEDQIVQFRLDGFTFSKLKPYQSWDQTYREAERFWEIYKNKFSPTVITRLAVRYINLIEIPSKSFDLEEYFSSPPNIPEGVLKNVEHFLTRVVFSTRAPGIKAILAHTTQPSKDPLSTHVILDIDVFLELNLEPQSPKISQYFKQLREIKNDIFFASVTEKCRELFRNS